MEQDIPTQLGALAHDKRLSIFRLLMRRYPDHVPAGEIADVLGLKANTASGYLNALRGAGLIEQSRVGTSLKYGIQLPNVRALFSGLLSDCCQNRPDICIPSNAQFAAQETPMPTQTRPFNALFICSANSARSIMAESILNAEGAGNFVAYSAGTTPSTSPRAEVIELLHHKGHDVSGLASKSVDAFSAEDAPKMDFVFTVCDHAANEACPTWPGQPISAHWGLPDPVKATGTEAEQNLAYQQAFGLLRNRISAFVALPFETLDRISLQHRVDDIGRITDTSDT